MALNISVSGNPNFYVGSVGTVTVWGGPPNANLTVLATGFPDVYTTLDSSGQWTYTNSGWTAAEIGSYTVTAIVGNESVSFPFTVIAKPVATVTGIPTVVTPLYTTRVNFLSTEFYVGSSYSVQVTGRPNSTVTADIASSPNGAFNHVAVAMGTTNSNGVFSVSDSWPNDNTWIGNWLENWSVAGSTTAQLVFTLAAQPPPPPPPLPAPVASTTKVTLNQNQQAVAFTFPGTVASPGDIIGVNIVTRPSHGTIALVSGRNYTYTPVTDYSGTDQIRFQLYGAGGVSNTDNVNIQVDALPIVVRPQSFTFSSYSNQISNSAVTGSSVTLGTAFLNTYTLTLDCVTDSAGPASTTELNASYVTGWTRNRGGNIQNLSNSITVIAGDIVTPVVRSATGLPTSVRTLTFTAKLTGSDINPGYLYTTNFTVNTQAVDLVADAFYLYDVPNCEVSSVQTTNTVTVGGLTSGFPVPIAVSPTATLIIGGIDAGDSSTISNGQTLAVRASSSADFSTSKLFTVTITGTNSSNNAVKITDTFTLTTRNPRVGPSAPWYFGNQVGLNPSTVYDTGTVTFTGMEEPAVFSINNGGLVVVNGNTGAAAASATINNGDTVYFRASSASTFSTQAIYTITLRALNVPDQTDSFSYTTRDSVNTPTFSGVFATLTQAELSSVIYSNAITATQFDGSQTITITHSDLASAQLIINGMTQGPSASIVSGDTVTIVGVTPADYYQLGSITVTVSAATLHWGVVTKSNDDLQLLTSF